MFLGGRLHVLAQSLDGIREIGMSMSKEINFANKIVVMRRVREKICLGGVEFKVYGKRGNNTFQLRNATISK